MTVMFVAERLSKKEAGDFLRTRIPLSRVKIIIVSDYDSVLVIWHEKRPTVIVDMMKDTYFTAELLTWLRMSGGLKLTRYWLVNDGETIHELLMKDDERYNNGSLEDLILSDDDEEEERVRRARSREAKRKQRNSFSTRFPFPKGGTSH